MRYSAGLIVAGFMGLGLAACSTGEEAAPGEAPAAETDVSGETGMPEFEEPTADREASMKAEAQSQAEAGVVYAGADRKDGSVTVPLGETLRIELETVPTAGYVWAITEQPEFLELTGEGSRPTNPAFQNQPGVTGGNHYMSFDLKAASAGTGVIRLQEGRPWETDQEPMATYELTVTVTAAE